jgi:hypothetical protein
MGLQSFLSGGGGVVSALNESILSMNRLFIVKLNTPSFIRFQFFLHYPVCGMGINGNMYPLRMHP